jgi:hypothetical protein
MPQSVRRRPTCHPEPVTELDDILSADAARAAAYRKEIDLLADHGPWFEIIAVPPELQDFVADFVTRVPATAGTPAYWVKREQRVTVHLPPERIRRFARVSKEARAANKRRYAAWAAERHDDARLLRLSVSNGEARDRMYFFVRLNGVWSPAKFWDGGDDWLWAAHAKEAMTDFVRAQR